MIQADRRKHFTWSLSDLVVVDHKALKAAPQRFHDRTNAYQDRLKGLMQDFFDQGTPTSDTDLDARLANLKANYLTLANSGLSAAFSVGIDHASNGNAKTGTALGQRKLQDIKDKSHDYFDGLLADLASAAKMQMGTKAMGWKHEFSSDDERKAAFANMEAGGTYDPAKGSGRASGGHDNPAKPYQSSGQGTVSQGEELGTGGGSAYPSTPTVVNSQYLERKVGDKPASEAQRAYLQRLVADNQTKANQEMQDMKSNSDAYRRSFNTRLDQSDLEMAHGVANSMSVPHDISSDEAGSLIDKLKEPGTALSRSLGIATHISKTYSLRSQGKPVAREHTSSLAFRGSVNYMKDFIAKSAKERGSKAFGDLASNFVNRIGQYAGHFWNAIQEGLGDYFRQTGDDETVERHLDPESNHCGTCPGKEGTYDSWQAMVDAVGVPGDLSDECGSGCRCFVTRGVEVLT